MMYQERKDGDTKLIKFTDTDSEGERAYDKTTYVKFHYDLSKRQLELIEEAADDIDYLDFDSFDEWVEAVIDKAESSQEWYDKKGLWSFWNPDPCLEIEV